MASSDERWAGMEKYIAVGFWGVNVGLAMRVVMSLWLRLPGDLVFIGLGVVPLAIAAIKGYLHVRVAARDAVAAHRAGTP